MLSGHHKTAKMGYTAQISFGEDTIFTVIKNKLMNRLDKIENWKNFFDNA